MNDLDLSWLGIAVALFLAGLAKGITGIGYATTAMPLLTLVAGLETALAIVVVPAIVSNAAVFVGAGNVVPTFFRFAPLYFGILPGIAAGTLLLPLVDVRLATFGLAVLTLAYVVLAVARPTLALGKGSARLMALPAGVLNGVLTGLTGSQILPLVPYMLALHLDARTQAIAINLAVTIASCALGASLLATGLMTGALLELSCAGALPAIAGTLLGNRLRAHLAVEAMRRLTLAMLVTIAVSLGGRPVWDAALDGLCRSGIVAEAPVWAAPCDVPVASSD